MPYEIPEDPDEQREQIKAFFETLGPVMLPFSWDAAVTAAVDPVTGEPEAHVLLRFLGRENGSMQLGTQSILFTLDEARELIRTLMLQLESLESEDAQAWLVSALTEKDQEE